MKKYNKIANKNSAIIGTLLTLILITSSCAVFSDDVNITLREKDNDNDEQPTIEIEKEVTWVQFDDDVLMYKVDLDKLLKDGFNLSEEALENSDVSNLINLIYEELGEALYAKDKDNRTLYNLDGRSVTVMASERAIYVSFHEGKYSVKYRVSLTKDNKTVVMSRSIEEDSMKFSKYFVISNREYAQSICLRESSDEYLSISLRKGDLFLPYNIDFATDMGKASVKLSKKDYETLHEIMLSYSDSDNLYEFLSDNIDLLGKYLDLIREENAVFYENVCGLINNYAEKAKVLSYE